MWKWWRSDPGREPDGSLTPPPPDSPVELPDPDEAREALLKAKAARRAVERLAHELGEMTHEIRAAREDNHFAEAIVDLIKAGK